MRMFEPLQARPQPADVPGPLPASRLPDPSQPTPPGPPYDVVEDIVPYAQTDRGPLSMAVFRPRDAASADPARRPCIVFFHGGAWRRGSFNQFMPFARLLAQRGMVAMSAQYRLLEGDRHALPVDALADARTALRWARDNAATYGIDTARLGAGGGSAGGHLALLTALAPAPAPAPGEPARTPDVHPACLLLMNPPLDFDAYESDVPLSDRRTFSPLHLLAPGALPPTLLMQGTKDRVVPCKQSHAFQRRAEQLGIDGLQLLPFEGRGHGFFNRGKGEPGDFYRAAKEMAVFLRQLGWLPPSAGA